MKVKRAIMKFHKVVITIIIVILIVSFSGCTYENNKNNNEEIKSSKPHVCSYRVEILLNFSDYYKIRIPIAINGNGSINEVMNNLSFQEGSGNYSIISIEKGFALEISGNGDAILNNSISVDWSEYQFPHLSLGNSTFPGDRRHPIKYTLYLDNISQGNWISIRIYLQTAYVNKLSYTRYDYTINCFIPYYIGEIESIGDFGIVLS